MCVLPALVQSIVLQKLVIKERFADRLHIHFHRPDGIHQIGIVHIHFRRLLGERLSYRIKHIHQTGIGQIFDIVHHGCPRSLDILAQLGLHWAYKERLSPTDKAAYAVSADSFVRFVLCITHLPRASYSWSLANSPRNCVSPGRTDRNHDADSPGSMPSVFPPSRCLSQSPDGPPIFLQMYKPEKLFPDIRLKNSRNEKPRRLYETTLPDRSGFSSFNRMTEEPEKMIFKSVKLS